MPRLVIALILLVGVASFCLHEAYTANLDGIVNVCSKYHGCHLVRRDEQADLFSSALHKDVFLGILCIGVALYGLFRGGR
jgi:hypothetical protein